MSDYEELMFEAEWEQAVEGLEQDMAVHAHTGDGCAFCEFAATPTAAKSAALDAVNRDAEWWDRTQAWLDRQMWGARFTADDLVAALGKPAGSTNQIGARLRSWALAGVIDPVGYTEAARKESHARVLRIWQVK